MFDVLICVIGVLLFLIVFAIVPVLIGYDIQHEEGELIGDYLRRQLAKIRNPFIGVGAQARSLFVATPAEKRKRRERSPYDYDPYEKGE